jgi:hypothetical protein
MGVLDLIICIIVFLFGGAFTLAKMLIIKKGSVKTKVIIVSVMTLIGIICFIYYY